jgi:hypothetical protein
VHRCSHAWWSASATSGLASSPSVEVGKDACLLARFSPDPAIQRACKLIRTAATTGSQGQQRDRLGEAGRCCRPHSEPGRCRRIQVAHASLRGRGWVGPVPAPGELVGPRQASRNRSRAPVWRMALSYTRPPSCTSRRWRPGSGQRLLVASAERSRVAGMIGTPWAQPATWTWAPGDRCRRRPARPGWAGRGDGSSRPSARGRLMPEACRLPS